MNVITSRPIYSNTDGPDSLPLNKPTNVGTSTKPTQLQGSTSTAQPTEKNKVFGNLFQKKDSDEQTKRNLGNIFQKRQANPVLYNKMLALSTSMNGMTESQIAEIMKKLTKEERSILTQIERERIRSERKDMRKNRKAKRNAKKLLRLKNKQGKELILFPLTRLRRNKDNKLVKTYPDGTETIVKPEMAVQITTIESTPTGPVKKVIEVDKAEVAEVLQVPINTVTPQMIEQKKIEVPIAQAPIQAQETKTIGTENVVGITIDPGNVTTDENGVSYASTQTQGQEEPIADVIDGNTTEEKKGMSLGLKIGIGVGIVVILGVAGYLIYRSTKK